MEYTNEEREFQILLHGGEPSKSQSKQGVEDHARKKLVDPRTVKRKN